MATNRKAFEGLAEAIRETGLFLENNAEALAPNVEHMTSMTIRINFDPMEAPTINVDYDAVSLEAAKAWVEAQRREER